MASSSRSNILAIVLWLTQLTTSLTYTVRPFTCGRSRHYRSPTSLSYVNDPADSPPPPPTNIQRIAEQHRRDWIDRSVAYYSKVMREERRKHLGQVVDFDTAEYQDDFLLLAKKHYFAITKVKAGKWGQAERIYRRIMREIMSEDCDHAQLAVTTLLLALLLQRTGDAKKTRSVFVNFFRLAVVEHPTQQCACSAKVLCAFALFEMKQGHARKSLEIARVAVQLDPSLQPVLQWKQFRDVVVKESTTTSRPASSLSTRADQGRLHS